MNYCASPYSYQRRLTREVRVGQVGIGGANPVRVQSMITCDTMDTAASIQQTLDLVAVGCEVVRITAPTVKDAANLQHIVAGLRAQGCQVPIVADIHFKPDAALEAARWVEKVRINPGNYADSKKFKILEYTDAEYAAELERIRERFTPLVLLCQSRGVAIRIGTNHGSLSDRIMNRYGDTPLGMVESALEFARIARDLGFHDFIFSMKSSNPKVMIEAYRLLVARLHQAGPDWNYPIHLGVTEAGDGEDGRIKSAIGIGSLLQDGIGDTVRVSLTEDSVHEIPVARALVAQVRKVVKNSQTGIITEKAEGGEIYPQFSRYASGHSVAPQQNTQGASGHRFEHVENSLGRTGALFARPQNLQGANGGPLTDRVNSEGTSGQPDAASENHLPVPVQTGAAPADADAALSPTALNSDEGQHCEEASPALSYDPFSYRRRKSEPLEVANLALGGEGTVRVFTTQAKWDALAHKLDRLGDYRPEIVLEDSGVIAVDPRDETLLEGINDGPLPSLVTVADGLDLAVIPAFRLLAARLDERHPILLKDTLFPEDSATAESEFLPKLLTAATNIGALLCDGIGDAILVQGEEAPGQSLRLSYNILQAAGTRIFKTDYVACPSCGRTLFNLQTTTAKIKAATAHLKGVKIAIMGCIVNGPGEMADADFGYVGGAPGKVNLYVGKQPVKFNIPEADAVERLQDLIREHHKWVDPVPEVAGAV